MMDKKQSRLRRARKTRSQIRELGKTRLCVFKTPKHMYAYLIDADASKTLACAATVQKEARSKLKSTGNIAAAEWVGEAIAKLAQKAGIEEVAFDRAGFKYHGRVKALAEAARKAGLKF